LAGGCCCCTGRPALIAALRSLCDDRSRTGGARYDRIVLETSGLADPGAIVAAIQADPVLVNHILVGETLVAVDALHALAQLATEPLGRRQVGAADRLILTKTDACAPADLDALRATLGQLNPGAAISAAVLGETVALPPLPPGTRPAPLPPLPEDDARGPILPTQIEVDPSLDWSTFALWLSALLHARGDDLVRVKGVLRTPAGRLLLQTVRKVVQSPEILPETADPGQDNRIVFIGRGYRPEDMTRSLYHFLGRPLPAALKHPQERTAHALHHPPAARD
jgi:G3E family GTPase